MTFLISLLIVLSKMINLKFLGKSYDFLLGLGIMMNAETLKYNSQWPHSIYTSAILINFLKHAISSTILLRYLYDNLSSPVISKLLHFAIELMNSSFENGFHLMVDLLGIYSSNFMLIWQFCTVLNDRWRYRLSSLIHGQLLY